MNKLTDFELHALYAKAFSDKSAEGIVTAGVAALRAIESAATEPLLQRIAELERLLEEARNQALEEAANAVDAMKAPDGYGIQEQSLYDVATMEAADVVRALKGAKE